MTEMTLSLTERLYGLADQIANMKDVSLGVLIDTMREAGGRLTRYEREAAEAHAALKAAMTRSVEHRERADALKATMEPPTSADLERAYAAGAAFTAELLGEPPPTTEELERAYVDARAALVARIGVSGPVAESRPPIKVYYGVAQMAAGHYDGGPAWRDINGYLLSPQPPPPASRGEELRIVGIGKLDPHNKEQPYAEYGVAADSDPFGSYRARFRTALECRQWIDAQPPTPA